MQNVFQFCLTVMPMMFSLSVFNVITDSMLTKGVPSSDTGEVLLPSCSHGTQLQNQQKHSRQLYLIAATIKGYVEHPFTGL